MDGLTALGNSGGVLIDAYRFAVEGQLQPLEVVRVVCAHFFSNQFLIINLIDEWFVMRVRWVKTKSYPNYCCKECIILILLRLKTVIDSLKLFSCIFKFI